MFGLAVLILAIFIATNERGLNALVDWYDDSTHIAQRSGANFISGAGVTITSADDPTNSRVALTFSAGGQSSSTVGDLLTSTDGVRISFATTTAVGDMLTANDTPHRNRNDDHRRDGFRRHRHSDQLRQH